MTYFIELIVFDTLNYLKFHELIESVYNFETYNCSSVRGQFSPGLTFKFDNYKNFQECMWSLDSFIDEANLKCSRSTYSESYLGKIKTMRNWPNVTSMVYNQKT